MMEWSVRGEVGEARAGKLAGLGAAVLRKLFWDFEGVEEFLEAVDGGCFGWVEELAQINDRVLDGTDRAGESSAGGVAVAAAPELFGEFDRLTVPAAHAGHDDAIASAEERHQDRIWSHALFEESMNDQVAVADNRVDKADGWAQFYDVLPAPFQAERILDAALDSHDFQEGVIEDVLQFAFDQGVEVPELVDFDEIGVVVGEDEIGISFQEEVGDVVKLVEAIELGGLQAVLATEFVAEAPGGFG